VLKTLLTAVAILAAGDSAIAQPAPKKPDDKTLVTKVYDLKAILGERGKANGYADMDAVIRLLVEEILPETELKPGTDGAKLIEREGGKIEVRATPETQKEIGDLIEALHRLVDVAIDIKADVVELDPAAFEKLTKALPDKARGKAGSPVVCASESEADEKEANAEEKKAFAEVARILAAGKTLQTSTTRFVNGVEGTFSARLSVHTFYKQTVNNNKQPESRDFVKDGFRLVGLPMVSVDRRFIRLKLTEQSTRVTGIKKREIDAPKDLKLVLTSLETEDLGATGSTVVADGSRTVFRLACAPKDKVWVVVLTPTLFIQAEEDHRKKEEKK